MVTVRQPDAAACSQCNISSHGGLLLKHEHHKYVKFSSWLPFAHKALLLATHFCCTRCRFCPQTAHQQVTTTTVTEDGQLAIASLYWQHLVPWCCCYSMSCICDMSILQPFASHKPISKHTLQTRSMKYVVMNDDHYLKSR